MASWDDLEQKYGASAPTPSAPVDAWADLEKRYSAPVQTPKVAVQPKAAANPDDFLPDDGVWKFVPNSVKAGIVATGREFDKLAQGARSGYLTLTGQDKELADLRAEESEKDQLYAPLAEKRPIATTVGTVAPYLAAAPQSFASIPALLVRGVAPKAAEKIATSMVIDGALQGAALGQLRQGDETNAVTGAVGGALGGALGRGVQKILSPNMSKGLTQQQQSVVQQAELLGARTTPGQALNNQTLQRIEAGLESNPLTSFSMRGVREANQKAVNRAGAKAVGETGDVLDAGALAQAEDRIGNVYKMVRTKTPVDLTSMTKPVSDIMDEARTLTMNPNAIDSDPLFLKTLDFVTQGKATQEELASLSSQLGKRAKSMMTSQQGDRDLGMALLSAKDHVDDALEGSLNGKTRQLFSDARSQYRNLMQLYKPGVVNEQTGDINAKVLANSLTKDRKGFRLGQNQSDLYTMGRFARSFPSIVGDSGTATRLALPLIGGASAGAGLGATSGGDPIKGAQYGLLAAALPMVAAKGYMSPAMTRYLANNVAGKEPADQIIRRLSIGTPTGLLAN